jgi:hypothetical protein
MGFPQPRATHEDHASLLPTAISERRADFNTPRKSTNPLKTKAYEKTNNMYHEIDHSYFCAFDARPDAGLLLKPTRDDDYHNASDYYDD